MELEVDQEESSHTSQFDTEMDQERIREYASVLTTNSPFYQALMSELNKEIRQSQYFLVFFIIRNCFLLYISLAHPWTEFAKTTFIFLIFGLFGNFLGQLYNHFLMQLYERQYFQMQTPTPSMELKLFVAQIFYRHSISLNLPWSLSFIIQQEILLIDRGLQCDSVGLVVFSTALFLWGLGLLMACLTIPQEEIVYSKIIVLLYMFTEFYQHLLILLVVALVFAFTPCILGFAYYIHRRDQRQRFRRHQFQEGLVGVPYNQIKNNSINQQCAICLEQFSEDQQLNLEQNHGDLQEDVMENKHVVLLECKHCFHSTCIREWVVLKADCPICRKKFT